MNESQRERHWSVRSRYACNDVSVFTPDDPATFPGKSTMTGERISGPYIEVDTSNDEYGSVIFSVADVRTLLGILEEDERAMQQKAAGLPSGEAIRRVLTGKE